MTIQTIVLFKIQICGAFDVTPVILYSSDLISVMWIEIYVFAVMIPNFQLTFFNF